MWSDNDIDKAFQRLDPPEPAPGSFPLDAWLRLETQLDKAVIARAVRRKLWRFFAAEVAVVALVVLGWLLWPTTPSGGKATALEPGNARSVVAPAEVMGVIEPSPTTVFKAPSATPTAPTALAGKPTLAAVAPSSTAIAVASAKRLATQTAVGPSVTRRLAVPTPATRRGPAPSPGKTVEKAALGSSTVLGRLAISTSRRPFPKGQKNTTYPISETATSIPVASAADSNAPTPPALPALASAELTNTAVSARPPNGRALRRPRAGIDAPAMLRAAALAPPLAVANGAAGAGTAENIAAPAGYPALTLRPVPVPTRPGLALPTVLAVAAFPETTLPGPERQPRFYLGLVGAPDVSTVKFATVEPPMPNVGVTLEYRLGNRLRFSTGLLRSTKQYQARREDYDWAMYSKAATRNFARVDGTCTVLDVPLNLRYDLLTRPQYQLFGSAGLSSFFMQREQYAYDYVEYGLPYRWEQKAVNANQHLLSILNLSVGYERHLGARWSVQAEPYLKLPLVGVGLGKVRLTSAGVFVGVKYGF